MYAKIFESIYEGSLVEDWKALIVFQQLIVLCDSEGVIDMTPTAISRRTNIPIDIINHGIEVLQETDSESRTKDEEGRRIILLDEHRAWGWFIVNHKKYRDLTDYETIKEQNRERQRRHREKQKSNVTVTPSNAQSRHTDTDTDTDTKNINGQSFDLFWSEYPKKVKKKTAKQIWARKKLDNKADEIITDVKLRPEMDDRWKAGFIPDPTTYLTQERWNDE